MESPNKNPFTVNDIVDCKIIIEAKGLHWSLIPTKDISQEEARECRVGLGKLALMVHEIVDCPLEDKERILEEQKKRGDGYEKESSKI